MSVTTESQLWHSLNCLYWRVSDATSLFLYCVIHTKHNLSALSTHSYCPRIASLVEIFPILSLKIREKNSLGHILLLLESCFHNFNTKKIRSNFTLLKDLKLNSSIFSNSNYSALYRYIFLSWQLV
jgi:hypothetical protein